MTALAGLWRRDGRPDAADGCARMLAAQQHYGPDAVAQWSDGDMAIGRRLMGLLPEDAFDRQPLVGGGGRYVLVADIRLDNRDELIERLPIDRHRAAGMADAGILLSAIERWDETCVDHLVGDYAFALWDIARRRLLLARDPLGQRPLHYHRGREFFAFASMPRGLHALPQVPYAADEERIAEFLVLMPETGSGSFFQGIERVEPGHLVTVTRDRLIARRYWQPQRQPIRFPQSDDYVAAMREHFDRAVQCRLRGTGDVGALMSGGFDSGAVAATAARLLAGSARRVVAFTAVPREGYGGPVPRNRIADEGDHAAAVAAHYANIEHVLIRGNRSPLDDLDRGFLFLERPALNLCNGVWVDAIHDAMRERGLTVALCGTMGNMGLSYNGLPLLPELIRQGHGLRWWREARSLVRPGPGGMRWRGVLANTFGPWCPAPLWIWLNRAATGHAYDVHDYSALNTARFRDLDLPGTATRRSLDFVYRPWKDGFAMRLWVLRRVDQGAYIKGILGGWRVDWRDPTADIRLLEFCLNVPTEQYLRDGVSRSLARRALADRLPSFILDESRKGLQAADWHERLTEGRDRLAEEIGRLEACPPAARALDLPRLRRLVDNWPRDGWDRPEVYMPYRYALLRAISAGHFLRRVAGGNA